MKFCKGGHKSKSIKKIRKQQPVRQVPLPCDGDRRVVVSVRGRHKQFGSVADAVRALKAAIGKHRTDPAICADCENMIMQLGAGLRWVSDRF